MKKIVSLVLLLTLVLSVSVFAESQDFQVKTKVKAGAGITESEWPADGQGVGNKDEGYMFSFTHSSTNTPEGSNGIVFATGVTLPEGLSPDVAGSYYLHVYYTGKEAPDKKHEVTITSAPFKFVNSDSSLDDTKSNDVSVSRTSNTANTLITVTDGSGQSIRTSFIGGTKVVKTNIGTYTLTWQDKATLPVGNYAAVVTITVASVV